MLPKTQSGRFDHVAFESLHPERNELGCKLSVESDPSLRPRAKGVYASLESQKLSRRNVGQHTLGSALPPVELEIEQRHIDSFGEMYAEEMMEIIRQRKHHVRERLMDSPSPSRILDDSRPSNIQTKIHYRLQFFMENPCVFQKFKSNIESHESELRRQKYLETNHRNALNFAQRNRNEVCFRSPENRRKHASEMVREVAS